MNDLSNANEELLKELQKLRQEHNSLKALYENDITARKLAEEKLSESEERFRSFFELTADLVCIASIDGYFQQLNMSWERVLGFTRQELMQKSYLDFVHPEDKEKTLGIIQEKLSRGETILSFENRYMCKNGGFVWLEWTSQPLPVKGVTFAIARNITERKKNEAALRENELLLRETQEIAHLGSFVWDITRGFWTSSNILDDIFGIDKTYIRSLEGWVALIYPDWREIMTDYVVNEVLGKHQRFDKEYKIINHKNGKEVWVHGLAELEIDKNSQPIRLIGTITDITQRKKEEQALTESEERYRVLLKGNILGILVFDIETHQCSFSNPAARKLFGYTEDEITKLNLADFHPRDSIEMVINEFQAQGRGEKSISDALPCLRKDGTPFYADIAGYATTFNGRNSSIGFIMDVTERKQAEELLQHTQLFLNSVIEHSPNSMWIADEHGTLIRLNQACRDNLHLKDDEVIGKYNIFEDNLIEEQGFMPMVRDVFKKGLTARFIIQYDTSAVKNLALERTIKVFLEVHISPIIDSQGKVTNVIIQHNDITERKMVEQALTESEEQYRVLLNGSSYGILAIDIETRQFLFSNPAICKLFGYTDEEFKQFSIVDLVPKESMDLTISEFLAQMRGEKHVSYAQSCIRKDGSIFYADIAGAPVVINGRKCNVGFFIDVTERKLTEEALKLSEEKYHSLFENVQDVFYRIDLAGIIQDISPSIKHFSEFNRGEIIGTNVADLYFDTDDRGILLKAIYEKGEVRNYELILKTKSNEKRVVSLNAKLIFNADGKPNHIDGAIRDITDRKLLENKIREKDIQFRKLSSNLPDLIYQFTKRPDGTYCVPIASEGIKNIFGCSPEDVLEDFEPIGRVIFPEDVERVINDIEYSAKHLTYFTCEFRVQIPGKPIQWIFSRSTPEKLADGSITWYGFNANITELKQTEMELVEAKEKAEESDRLKSAFLANMSHEIRTPMNGILGFAGLLKEPQLTGKEQQNYISFIEKSGKRMLNIINDIVNISKIESGQMEVSIKETDINEQIEFIDTFFRPEIEKKGIRLLVTKVLPLNECKIKTDLGKIYAILSNIVGNALKYTHAGSIKIGVDKKGDFLEFFVKDTGKGVPENQRKIIFERFRQSNDLITEPYEGAGLGLSISKAYVEMLGGEIWLESELGKGSTFYFTIPFTVDMETIPAIKNGSAHTEADHQVKNLKILIAEDDEDSAYFLSAELKTYCREILTAGTGVEAVEACRNNPDIDLVLMDIRMPDLDGYSATRQIQQFNKDVIIIAQTAYAMTDDREKAIVAGCNDYISKPIVKDELQRLIQKYFSKYSD